MSTPEELLCSRKWRLARGLWMVLGWVPLSLTAWIGYLIIGIKAKNWKWILISVALLAWLIVFFAWVATLPVVAKGEAMPEGHLLSSNLSIVSSLIVWLGNALVLQPWINRKWLAWRAHNDKSVPWYATATRGNVSVQTDDPRGVAASIDNAFGQGSVSSTRAHGTAESSMSLVAPSAHEMVDASSRIDQAPVLIDINDATPADLATLPGIDVETAMRVVAARAQMGRFEDTADLVTRAGIKPHVFARLRDSVVVVADGDAAREQPASLRPPSPENGRRLEF